MPASAKEALRYAREKGVMLFVATGRHKNEFEHMEWMRDSFFDGFVTVNGGYCYTKKQIIHKTPIHKDTVRMVVDYILQNPFYCIFCEEHESYTTMANDNAKMLQLSLGLTIPQICNPTRAINAEIFQMVPFDVDMDDPFLQQLPNCTVTSWSEGCFDIAPSGVNKWTGILPMLKHFGISPHEVVTFGDNQNDMEMLAGAGYSVAMGNGLDAAKKCATYVTSHVDDDGILKAIKHLLGACNAVK